MKKFYSIISLCVLVLGVQGQVLVYDGFDYSVGDLGTNGGWVPRSTGTDIQVISDNLTFTGFTSSTGNAAQFSTSLGGKDPQRAFDSQSSGVVYASFLLKVTDLTGATAPRYSFGLSNATDPATASGNYTSCLYIKSSTNGYQIGINRGTTDTETQWAPAEIALSSVVLVVVSYDITNQVSKLWINPASSSFGGTTEPELAASASSGNFPGTNSNIVASVFFRQTNTQNPVMVLDELRIGTTWANVTPKVTALKNVLQNNFLKLSTNILADQISVIGGNDISKVDFYSLDSKLVKSYVVNGNNALSVSGISKGMYLVKITSGNNFNIQKVIKE
jgi:hypothetical protein